jgi:hypothetical protein
MGIVGNSKTFWELSSKYNFSKYTHSHAFELIDLINLLRIEPYVSKQNEKILRDCIESHQYYVNFNNSNGRIIQ